MNILIFTATFHPSLGGLERQTSELTCEFLKSGHKVKVINMSCNAIAKISSMAKSNGIDIYYQPGFVKRLQLFIWCNILYMPNMSLSGIWLLLINPFKKWVVSHNDFYLRNTRSIRIRIKRFLIKFAAHNIAVSRSVADCIITKSTVIYNCYNGDVFKVYKDEQRMYDFVFLGRLVSQKGCDLLIKACANLKHPFTFNIIGDGPERLKLHEMVEQLGLKSNIKFLGILEGEHLARVLNRHRTMVIPSVAEEGFGIVALEGLACGCGIIAADAGGLSEAVNGFGKLFKMKNQKALEVLLEEALMEPKYGNNNPIDEELERYLVARRSENVAKNYLLLFEK